MVRTHLALLGTLVNLSFAAVGCESSRCGGNPRDDDADAPLLLSFYVLDDTRQIPGDPWTVVLGADFEDTNGDLGAGLVEFYLNANSEPAAQPLDTVFRQSGLATTAKRGSFWVTLRFAEETVDDGTRVTLGMQLVDGDALRGNCYTLDLAFDVTPLGAGIRSTWQPICDTDE